MKMQLANCTVRLGGRVDFTVPKTNVSVAEILVLRAVHGSDAVLDVVLSGSVNVTPSAEVERLVLIYGLKEQSEKMIRDMFPGAMPSLPANLTDILTDKQLGLETADESAPTADDGLELEDDPTQDGAAAAAAGAEPQEPDDYTFLNAGNNPAAPPAIPPATLPPAIAAAVKTA